MLKSDPTAVKRFEDMFAKVKSGGGLPKELLKKLENKKKVVIEPEELLDVTVPDELITTKLGEESEEVMEEIDVDDSNDELYND
jgi:hypothetical protein